MSDSLRTHGLGLTRLLCAWGFPIKNTGVGCHSFLQGIFPTQGLNLVSWETRQTPSCEPLEKPLGKPLLLGSLILLLLYVFPILNFFQYNVYILFILQDLFYLYVLFSICYSFQKLTCSCIFLREPRYVRNVTCPCSLSPPDPP